ncbi:periplasmic nitrate reductase chaperone NapD [Sinobacterium caligoides]|uniref:Chaperone NapD n=1 Tax=Sinobacterium caligoides TaxID=933926 RepID=A0A3N2DP39_9GAMM|nr:chaperone NapD [Sinobacterium caligoides]ROS01560.1 periplasmic nitrate reductase chaperone NapD [Sinobacterium caligoides]
MNTFEHIPAEQQEWHIASLVVQGLPKDLDRLQATLNNLANASVAACDGEKGKIIVIVEADNAKALANTTDQIRITEHVLDAHLVYHQIADKNTLDDVIDDTEISLPTDLLE